VLLLLCGCTWKIKVHSAGTQDDGTVTVPRVVERSVSGKGSQDWARAAVNFSRRLTANNGVWTFAVVEARRDRDPDGAVFRRHLADALSLGPRFVVVAGNPPVSSALCETTGVPVFVAGTTLDNAVIPVSWECGGRTAFVLFPECGDTGDGVPAAFVAALTRLRRRSADQASVVICGSNNQPPDFAKQLRRLPGTVLVVNGGADAFSWSPSPAFPVLDLGWGDDRVAPDVAAVADGRFSGFIWGCVHDDRIDLKAVGRNTLVPVVAFARSGQQERRGMRDSLRAGVCGGSEPVTEVSLVNPSASPLDFRASWTFTDGPVRVDPQILGFRLGSGETFRQKFRFISEPGIPLKFRAPILTLETVHTNVHGVSAPLVMCVAPWCCMSGELEWRTSRPIVDGDLAEWTGDGYALSHAKQVLRGLDQWEGPLDLSATVNAGWDRKHVYLAVQVLDDQTRAAGDVGVLPLTEVFVDLRPASVRQSADGVFGDSGGALRIRIRADGKHEVLGVDLPDPGLKIATAPVPQGGVGIEIRLSAVLFPDGLIPAEFVFDVAVEDYDQGAAAGTRMFFSGDPDDSGTSARYAVFRRSAAPENQTSE